jgi:hypothetical protein
MGLRILVPTLVVVALGLSGCGKTEEPTEQQATPETSDLPKDTTSSEMQTETARQGSTTAPSAGR